MITIQNSTSDLWPLQAAQTIAGHLRSALLKGGKASLVLPGGRTAKQFLPHLADEPLTWSKVSAILSDERWVSPNHPDSNERLIREALSGARGLKIVGLKTDDDDPALAFPELQSRLAQVTQPFSVVVLGMGEDGHVASLFPGQPVSNETFLTASRPDHARISMTPTTLLNSCHIVLPICGNAKRQTFEVARQDGPASDFPVRYILQQDNVDVTVILG